MPTNAVPDFLRAQLSEMIAERMGLHFPPERWADLERGLAGAAKEFDLADVAACVEWLLSAALTKAQLEVLASYLTVGETYFFREKKTFDVFAESILPELIHARRAGERRLRIWSAACCTGEEPYSLAILLSQVIPDLADWHVTILATDINERFLKKAAAGVYGEWSFRESPAWFKDRYFRRTADGHYAILPEIKKRVTFAHLNLAEDVFPSLETDTNAMDLIFCRNVLMYFTLPQARKVVEKSAPRAGADEGWLVVSPCESSQVLFSHFAAVNFPGVILYRKSEVKERATPSWTPAAGSSGRNRFDEPLFRHPSRCPHFPPAVQPRWKSRCLAKPPPTPHAVASLALRARPLRGSRGDAAGLARLVRRARRRKWLPCSPALWPTKANLPRRWRGASAGSPPTSSMLPAIICARLFCRNSATSSRRIAPSSGRFISTRNSCSATLRSATWRERATSPRRRTNISPTPCNCWAGAEPDDPLPESEGLTAARLTEIIHSITVLAATA